MPPADSVSPEEFAAVYLDGATRKWLNVETTATAPAKPTRIK